MRNWCVRNRFEFVYFKDTKIRQPSMVISTTFGISEQRIMVRGQIFRHPRSGDRLVEHATKRHAVYMAGVHAETDDPPSKLSHNDENPVRLQGDGVTPKQIDAPETIFCVADERQPRPTSSAGPWPVVLRKNPPHHVLVYPDTKRLRELLCSPRAPVAGVPSLPSQRWLG